MINILETEVRGTSHLSSETEGLGDLGVHVLEDWEEYRGVTGFGVPRVAGDVSDVERRRKAFVLSNGGNSGTGSKC